MCTGGLCGIRDDVLGIRVTSQRWRLRSGWHLQHHRSVDVDARLSYLALCLTAISVCSSYEILVKQLITRSHCCQQHRPLPAAGRRVVLRVWQWWGQLHHEPSDDDVRRWFRRAGGPRQTSAQSELPSRPKPRDRCADQRARHPHADCCTLTPQRTTAEPQHPRHGLLNKPPRVPSWYLNNGSNIVIE